MWPVWGHLAFLLSGLARRAYCRWRHPSWRVQTWHFRFRLPEEKETNPFSSVRSWWGKRRHACFLVSIIDSMSLPFFVWCRGNVFFMHVCTSGIFLLGEVAHSRGSCFSEKDKLNFCFTRHHTTLTQNPGGCAIVALHFGLIYPQHIVIFTHFSSLVLKTWIRPRNMRLRWKQN